jgi:hypothetical protein
MSIIRGLVRPVVRALTSTPLGLDGITLAFGAAEYTEGVDDDDVSLTVTEASLNEDWSLSITSSGGGDAVTASGTVAAQDFTIGSLDLTGLDPGALTAVYSENGIDRAIATATLN